MNNTTKKAIVGLTMYIEAIEECQNSIEFDRIYNYVVKNKLCNLQITNLIADLSKNPYNMEE